MRKYNKLTGTRESVRAKWRNGGKERGKKKKVNEAGGQKNMSSY